MNTDDAYNVTVKSVVAIELEDVEKRMAFGMANVFRTAEGDAVVDSHEDTIDTDEAIALIEDAVYRYVLDSRSGDEQHVNYGIARLVESFLANDEKREALASHATEVALKAGDTRPEEEIHAERLEAARLVIPDAWWVGFKIDDPDVWEKVKDGTYSMFSIVGRGRRVPIDD